MEGLFDAVRGGQLERVLDILKRHPEAVHSRDARDSRFGATPAGWAIEYLRARGALLGMEIEDLAYARSRGDEEWERRFVERLPALRHAR